MKRLFFNILCIFAVSLAQGAPAHAESIPPQRESIYPNFEVLRDDLLELIEFRAQAVADYEKIRAKVENKTPFNGQELNQLHEAVVTKRPLLERLLTFAQQERKLLRFNPQDLGNDDRLLYLKVLAIELTLADTYWTAIHFYHEDNRLRRIINEGHSILRKDANIMKRLLRRFLRTANIDRIAEGVNNYENSSSLGLTKAVASLEVSFLTTLIDQSLIFSEYRIESHSYPANPRKFLLDRLEYRHKPQDLTHKIGTSMIYAVSKVFGNGLGLVQFRSGLLHRNISVEQDVSISLQALDILMEKTPFRLTDKFIPGYWGHAAIWLGSESEIRALGLWDHPALIPLHEEIRSGHSIMQALRPGTSIDNVRSFLNVDDVAVLRMRNMSIEEKRKSLIVAASQYHKIYDFAFDVETQNTLVCSELVFMSFLNTDWRLEKTLGRWTINPDSVAERAVPGGELDVVLLYTGGKKQISQLDEKMDHILKYSNRGDKKLLRDFSKADSSATLR